MSRIVEVRSPDCAEPVLLDARGHDPVASMLYWHGLEGWEPETLPVFLRLVKAGRTVLDVGANTGLFSLFAARRSPTATVHAIEPVPRVFAMLEANVTRNGLLNVTCHRLALSNTSGTAAMYVPGEEVPVMASLLPGWRSGSATIEVDTCTLDELVARLGISDLDLIKIDTEGTEDDVISGAAATLRDQQPIVICEVLAAGNTADHLTERMGAAGYQFLLLGPDGPRRTDRVLGAAPGACANYLFVPESRAAEVRALLGI